MEFNGTRKKRFSEIVGRSCLGSDPWFEWRWQFLLLLDGRCWRNATWMPDVGQTWEAEGEVHSLCHWCGFCKVRVCFDPTPHIYQPPANPAGISCCAEAPAKAAARAATTNSSNNSSNSNKSNNSNKSDHSNSSNNSNKSNNSNHSNHSNSSNKSDNSNNSNHSNSSNKSNNSPSQRTSSLHKYKFPS